MQGKIKSDFPKHTLEQAIRVPQALEDANGGQPLPPMETAAALGMSPGSSTFRTLLSAGINYGLTDGSYKAERVSLRPTGRSIVEPTGIEDRQRALVTATLTPATFRKIYEYYKGKKLPEQSFFENAVVRDFDIPREHAKICVSIFKDNMQFVGLIRDIKGSSWLSSEAAPAPAAPAAEQPEAEEEEFEDIAEQQAQAQPPARRNGSSADAARNAIFVGHGKNKKPLEQLKQILEQYHIPHKVAVDEPNRGRPISQKVAETMKECGAAILIFTADEELRGENGEVVWKPSDNVVYELGAASALYGGKIIVFKEEGVDFPANFRDIGYISFEKDALSNKTNELFKELIAFGLIRVTVGG